MMTALKKDFNSTLDEKDAKIHALEKEIRGYQQAVDQHDHEVLATELDRLYLQV